jgi:hypothetical protein
MGMWSEAAILGGVFPGPSLTPCTILPSISGLQTVLYLPPSAAANTNVPLSRWRPLMPETFPLLIFCDIEMHAGKDDFPQLHCSNYARPHIMLASYTSANACTPTKFTTSGLGYLSRYSESLRPERSRDRISVEGENFRTSPDRRWALPNLLYNGHRVSFPGVRRPGHGADHPTLASYEVKERVELYPYSPSGPSWPVPGWTLPFNFTCSAQTE